MSVCTLSAERSAGREEGPRGWGRREEVGEGERGAAITARRQAGGGGGGPFDDGKERWANENEAC